MKKKLLIVTDNNLCTVGGVQESTKIILTKAKNLLDVSVIQPGQEKPDILDIEFFCLSKETRLKHIFRNPYKFLMYGIKLMNIINNTRPDIIHTQDQVGFFMISLLIKLKFIKKRFKFIHTERGLYSKYNNFFIFLFKTFIGSLDAFVVTTSLNEKLWSRTIREKNIKLNIIENTAGMPFENFKIKVENNKKMTIGFAGRYCDWKNWSLSVDIVKKLIEVGYSDFSVKMTVGCLDEKSVNETNQMFDELHELLGDNFYGSINLSFNEMMNFYEEIDIFIVTSNKGTESFGRTVVEAMSCFTVVLTTPCGGPEEIIDDVNLVLDSVDNFVKKVVTLQKNPKQMKQIKERNLDIVKLKYSLQNNIEKHNIMYNELLN